MIVDIITMIALPTIIAVFTWAEMKRNHEFRNQLVHQVIEFSEVLRRKTHLQDQYYQAIVDLQDEKIRGLDLKVQRLTLRVTGDGTRDL